MAIEDYKKAVELAPQDQGLDWVKGTPGRHDLGPLRQARPGPYSSNWKSGVDR